MRVETKHVVGLTVLLSLSLIGNVVHYGLIWNAERKVGLAMYTRQGDALRVGDPAPSLDLRDLAGTLTNYDPKRHDLPTVLYVFTPSCVWCERNADNVAALAKASARFRFAGVSLSREGLADFLKANPMDFPIYVEPSDATRRAYYLSSTPMTILIRNGRVERVWHGAFSEKSLADAEQSFGVELPGLRPVSQ